MVDVLLIGASTGGPSSLYKIIDKFPENFHPPIVIIQHMPPTFEDSLAEVLRERSNKQILIIENGMKLEKDKIYIAKGGFQSIINANGTFTVYENDNPDIFAPSINITILSFAKYYKNIVATILSGLATRQDGLEACKELFKRGNMIILQNKESSIVYGMQKNIKEAGYFSHELDLFDIPDKILSFHFNNIKKI